MKEKREKIIANILLLCSLFFIGLGLITQYKLSQNKKLNNKTTKNEISSDLIISKEAKNNMNNTNYQKEHDENDKLRKNIENKYHIKIRYGKETSNYKVGGLSTKIIKNKEICKKNLEILNEELSHYPKNLFKEISKKNYTLTIYLIKNYSQKNITGMTDSTSKDVKISLAIDYDFKDTLNHEIYHYIEKYLLENGANFKSWNELNPYGFKYGNIKEKYSYESNFSENAFFVNDYAQKNEYEDRASTFEYMMKESKASCLNRGSTVWLKARKISEELEKILDSVSPKKTEYWELHI